MTTKAHVLFVRGNRHQWAFCVQVNPKDVPELREDGLEINELGGSVPMWIAQAGLTRPWVFIQDVFHLRNPFA